MTDQSPMGEQLFSFGQQQPTSPTKPMTSEFYENYSSKESDPFGNHNGNGTNGQDYYSSNGTNGNKHDEYHQYSLNNDLFPVDTTGDEKGKLTYEIIINKERNNQLI